MKGLIIKPYWADLILSGQKTMELRGSNTKIRGRIGIIKSKTGQVYGEVDIVDCVPLSKEEFNQYKEKHKVICDFEDIPYKNLYGWVLENVKIYDKPIPYKHKQGCVIWVNLDESPNSKDIYVINSRYLDDEIKENLGIVYDEAIAEEQVKKLNSLRGAEEECIYYSYDILQELSK